METAVSRLDLPLRTAHQRMSTTLAKEIRASLGGARGQSTSEHVHVTQFHRMRSLSHPSRPLTPADNHSFSSCTLHLHALSHSLIRRESPSEHAPTPATRWPSPRRSFRPASPEAAPSTSFPTHMQIIRDLRCLRCMHASQRALAFSAHVH